MIYFLNINLVILAILAGVFGFFTLFLVALATVDKAIIEEIVKDSEIKNPWVLAVLCLVPYVVFSSLGLLLYYVSR